MEHFKGTVPQGIRDKLHNIITIICDDSPVCFSAMNVELCGDFSIDEIPGVHRSGWIPFQRGGYEVCAFFANDDCQHFTVDQKEYNERQYARAVKQFAHAKSLPEYFDFSELAEDVQSEFTSFIAEWFDPALLGFQLYAENSDMITVRAFLNYKDAPYYRDNKSDTLFQISYTFEQFDKVEPQDVIKAIAQHIEGVK